MRKIELVWKKLWCPSVKVNSAYEDLRAIHESGIKKLKLIKINPEAKTTTFKVVDEDGRVIKMPSMKKDRITFGILRDRIRVWDALGLITTPDISWNDLLEKYCTEWLELNSGIFASNIAEILTRENMDQGQKDTCNSFLLSTYVNNSTDPQLKQSMVELCGSNDLWKRRSIYSTLKIDLNNYFDEIKIVKKQDEESFEIKEEEDLFTVSLDNNYTGKVPLFGVGATLFQILPNDASDADRDSKYNIYLSNTPDVTIKSHKTIKWYLFRLMFNYDLPMPAVDIENGLELVLYYLGKDLNVKYINNDEMVLSNIFEASERSDYIGKEARKILISSQKIIDSEEGKISLSSIEKDKLKRARENYNGSTRVDDVINLLKKNGMTSDKSIIIQTEKLLSNVKGETEKTRLVKTRIGQGKWRSSLIDKYGEKCAFCGVNHKRLLIASHIKAWSKSDNEEKLSLNNGLVLCRNHDVLFEYGHIKITSSGEIMFDDIMMETKMFIETQDKIDDHYMDIIDHIEKHSGDERNNG